MAQKLKAALKGSASKLKASPTKHKAEPKASPPKPAAGKATGAKASQDKAGPLLGKPVRVELEAAGKDKFGKVGTVEGHWKDGSLQVRVATTGQPLRTQEAFVGPTGAAGKVPGQLRTLRQTTRLDRRSWLEAAHFGDEASDRFEPVAKELEGKAPILLSQHHLQLFWRHLTWGLQVPEGKVVMLDPELVWVWDQAGVEGEEAVVARTQAALQRSFEVSPLLLCPLWLKGGPHWVLLVVEKEEAAARCGTTTRSRRR